MSASLSQNPKLSSVATTSRSKRYKKIKLLGEGTFGVVHLARDLETNQLVAVKKVRMGRYKDGISITALREIKILKEVRHPCVIRLADVFSSGSNVNLVVEYCVADLEVILRDKMIFLSHADIKSCIKMILDGVGALHRNWVLHRDLKPSNLLIGQDGRLKVADFGLARLYGSPDPRYTHQVVTRWYRPPELLFGAKQYGSAVDVWSIGVIFAEILLRMPYLPGESDIDQLAKIFQARGTPNEKNWPGVKYLPDFVQFQPLDPPDHRRVFSGAPPDALSLLNDLLSLDPSKRPSCHQALQHEYFYNLPPPTDPKQLLQKLKTGTCIKEIDDGDIALQKDTVPVVNSLCRSDERAEPGRNSFGKRKLEFT